MMVTLTTADLFYLAAYICTYAHFYNWTYMNWFSHPLQPERYMEDHLDPPNHMFHPIHSPTAYPLTYIRLIPSSSNLASMGDRVGWMDQGVEG